MKFLQNGPRNLLILTTLNIIPLATIGSRKGLGLWTKRVFLLRKIFQYWDRMYFKNPLLTCPLAVFEFPCRPTANAEESERPAKRLKLEMCKEEDITKLPNSSLGNYSKNLFSFGYFGKYMELCFREFVWSSFLGLVLFEHIIFWNEINSVNQIYVWILSSMLSGSLFKSTTPATWLLVVNRWTRFTSAPGTRTNFLSDVKCYLDKTWSNYNSFRFQA